MPPKRLKSGSSSRRAPPPHIKSEVPATESTSSATGDTSSSTNFLQELAWCLDQLELKIKQSQSNPKEAKSASRSWKVLSDPNTPLVKKRQLMRCLFGDYRVKMQQEERQYSVRPQDMHIRQVTNDKSIQAQYFKSSSYSPVNQFASTTKNFEFNFNIDNSNSGAAEAAGAGSSEAMSSQGSAICTEWTEKSEVPVNYYYLPPSSNREHGATSSGGFSFNFDLEQDEGNTM